MTVGGWILFVVVAVCIFCGAMMIAIYKDAKIVGFITAFVISAVLIIGLFALMHWYFNSTASGKRAFKTQESNFGDGVERIVRVYDMEGDLIESYDGKFDITYDDDRVLFDDEKGKRHIIYYPTGTVLIDEK